jgi:hypothetical protein
VAKKSAGPNKSDAIRKYKADHPKAGPTEIAEGLGKEGVGVTAAFVSTVLSNDRRRSGKRGRRGRRGRVAVASNGRRSTGGRRGRRAGDPLQTLVQAKRLADQLGGIDKARSALDALARILG